MTLIHSLLVMSGNKHYTWNIFIEGRSFESELICLI